MLDDDGGGFFHSASRYHQVVSGVDGIAEMVQHLFVPSHRLHRRSGRCHELVGRRQAGRVPHRDASLDLLADLRLDEVGASRRAVRWGRAARHRERRDDVRRPGTAAGLCLGGPRPREHKACARDCLEEPVPDLGVAVPEDDGDDSVRMDNPARFGECPGDGRVVVVPSAVVRRCLPSPEPFDDDFFGLLLNA